jgi:hypothetical protein
LTLGRWCAGELRLARHSSSAYAWYASTAACHIKGARRAFLRLLLLLLLQRLLH